MQVAQESIEQLAAVSTVETEAAQAPAEISVDLEVVEETLAYEVMLRQTSIY